MFTTIRYFNGQHAATDKLIAGIKRANGGQFERNLVVGTIEHSRIIGFYALRHLIPKSYSRIYLSTEMLNGKELEVLLHGHRLGADTMELTSDPLARDFYTKAGAEDVRVLIRCRVTQHIR